MDSYAVILRSKLNSEKWKFVGFGINPKNDKLALTFRCRRCDELKSISLEINTYKTLNCANCKSREIIVCIGSSVNKDSIDSIKLVDERYYRKVLAGCKNKEQVNSEMVKFCRGL